MTEATDCLAVLGGKVQFIGPLTVPVVGIFKTAYYVIFVSPSKGIYTVIYREVPANWERLAGTLMSKVRFWPG